MSHDTGVSNIWPPPESRVTRRSRLASYLSSTIRLSTAYSITTGIQKSNTRNLGASNNRPLADNQNSKITHKRQCHATSTRTRGRWNIPPIVPPIRHAPPIPSPTDTRPRARTHPRTRQRRTPSSTVVPIVPHPILSTHVFSFPLPLSVSFALLSLAPLIKRTTARRRSRHGWRTRSRRPRRDGPADRSHRRRRRCR